MYNATYVCTYADALPTPATEEGSIIFTQQPKDMSVLEKQSFTVHCKAETGGGGLVYQVGPATHPCWACAHTYRHTVSYTYKYTHTYMRAHTLTHTQTNHPSMLFALHDSCGTWEWYRPRRSRL